MKLPFEPPSFHDAVEADYYRATADKFSWRGVIFEALRSKTFAPVLTLRMSQSSFSSKSPFRRVLFLVSRILHRWACDRLCIEMPWSINIGRGLLIVHGWGLVINGGAIIGRNVTLCHCVTIGARDTMINGRRTIVLPEVGDDVYVGPHACVLGCRIGEGSFLAPHALVVQSTQSNCLLTPPKADLRSSNFTHTPINTIRDLETDRSSDHAQSRAAI